MRAAGRKKGRRIIYRRMGVLAAAIAVPAMAAPGLEPAPQPQVIRFVIPETIPYQPSQGPVGTGEAAALPAPVPQSSLIDPGAAAPAFPLSGGLTTRLRAEHCLTMAIYYEAASESTSGQRAVAQVVMNRVQHPAFPNSVCGVVLQGAERSTGCQFSFTCDGSLARSPSNAAWNRAERVARAALGGFVYPDIGLATHYHTLAVNPYWASSLSPVGDIGAHRFYRWTGDAGRRAAFTARHAGVEQSPARLLAAARTYPAMASDPSPLLPTPALPAAQPHAPVRAEMVPATPAAGDEAPAALQLPGSVLDIHSRSGQWLDQP